MTAITMNYVVNPLAGIWNRFQTTMEIVGYARAAGELTRLGYHKEAQHCVDQMISLRESR